MSKRSGNGTPTRPDRVALRGRGTQKFRKMARRIAQRTYRGDCYDEFETILTRTLRRTDAAAEKRGIREGALRHSLSRNTGDTSELLALLTWALYAIDAAGRKPHSDYWGERYSRIKEIVNANIA